MSENPELRKQAAPLDELEAPAQELTAEEAAAAQGGATSSQGTQFALADGSVRFLLPYIEQDN